MALTRFNIDVNNIADVIQFYDQLIVERSETGIAGPYIEITSASTRPTLVAGTTRYEYLDINGAASYYYRSRFANSLGDYPDSSASSPVIGAEDSALSILSVAELKQHFLYGIDLTDEQLNPIPDSAFEFYIKAAVAQAEQVLDLPIIPKVFAEEPPADGEIPENADFYVKDYWQWILLQLQHFPIIEVSEIKMVLPGRQEIINFPVDWFQDYVDYRTGKVQIIPGSGQAAILLLGNSGAWAPLLAGWSSFIPSVFRISYTAGFKNGVPANIKEMIGMMASFGPLNVAGDLVLGAGIAREEIGLDGLMTSISTTQSPTNAGYGARLLTYRRRLAEMVPEIRRYWKGVRIVVG